MQHAFGSALCCRTVGLQALQCLRTTATAASWALVDSKAYRNRFLPSVLTCVALPRFQAISTSSESKDPAGRVDSGPLPKQEIPRLPTFGEVMINETDGKPSSLSDKDSCLIQLYVAGCNHYWNMLPELAEQCYQNGASQGEVWAAIRHLIVFAGYAPCLAATIQLRQRGLLNDPTAAPGKVAGPPGNAFELVYDKVTDVVRGKLYHWDPVLSEYIRLHLYGDVYSSPGLSMAQKQLLSVAFLGEANMHDQLYTHLIAAMRFGNSRDACAYAIKIGFRMSPRPAIVLRSIIRSAMRSLQNAHSKFQGMYPDGPPPMPEVYIPDPACVGVPSPPASISGKGPVAPPADGK